MSEDKDPKAELDESVPVEPKVDVDTATEDTVQYYDPEYLGKVKLRKELFEPGSGEEVTGKPKPDDIILLGITRAELDELNPILENVRYREGSAIHNWHKRAQQALLMSVRDEENLSPFYREDAVWENMVMTENGPVCPLRPNPKTATGGAAARLRLNSELKIGDVRYLPMWNSGYWLQLRAMSPPDRLQLHRRIIHDKNQLGKSTFGAGLNHLSALLNLITFEFLIANCMTGCNLGNKDLESIKRSTKYTDIPLLHAYASGLSYPNGFSHVFTCTADPSKCTYTEEVKIDTIEMVVADTNSLTEEQLRILSNRTGTITPEMLKAYSDASRTEQTRLIQVSPSIQLKLWVPSVKDVEDRFYAWVDSINTTVSNSYSGNLSPEARTDIIASMADLIKLCWYDPWVEAVVYTENPEEEPEYITNRSDIYGYLESISANEEATANVIKSIHQFERDVIIGAVGYKRHKCPKCGEEAPKHRSPTKLPSMVMQETAMSFFTHIGKGL